MQVRLRAAPAGPCPDTAGHTGPPGAPATPNAGQLLPTVLWGHTWARGQQMSAAAVRKGFSSASVVLSSAFLAQVLLPRLSGDDAVAWEGFVTAEEHG